MPYKMSKASKSKRLSTGEIRNKMRGAGALFFSFEDPLSSSDETYDDRNTHIKWFSSVIKYGLLVTTEGCIFAYENFYSASKGRPKAHKVSALFFKGKMPEYSKHEHGWPVECQVSHLCHKNSCINPLHLVYEPQWCNLKRNYCGENGTCDCGRTPPCIKTYHNGEWIDPQDQNYLTYETPNLDDLLASLLPGLNYTLLSKTHYDNTDKKKVQRNEKLKTKRKAKSQKVTSEKEEEEEEEENSE